MANSQTSGHSERSRTWVVGDETHWHHGFADIGSGARASYLYGPLGSSGFLAPTPRRRPNNSVRDLDETETRGN